MLSSSRLISSANRARSDIDQVIQSLSSEQSSSSDARGCSEESPDVPEDALKSSNNCAVERYHDLDGCQQKSAFHLYSCGELAETYTQQLQFDDKSQDPDDDTPISSIWESRWFDHAALVGRFMAEDKIHSDQGTATYDTRQYIPVPSHDLDVASPAVSEPLPVPERVEVEKTPPAKSRASSTVKSTHFKCKIQGCQADFSTQSQRWYHQKSAHTQIQLQCPECHKVFVKLQQLEVHLRSHLKLKIYKCPEEGCDKSFLTHQQCKNHALIHTGEKNYECSVCRKKFREKNTLTRHSRTHTQIKLYRCDVCHKSFSYASSLRVHRKHFHTRSIAELETIATKTADIRSMTELETVVAKTANIGSIKESESVTTETANPAEAGALSESIVEK